MSAGARLRELLAGGGPVVAPGAMNAFFARIVERAGFPAVYMSGAGVANGMLGMPDIGLTTLSEMAQSAANMANAVSVPVIADGDNGFGGTLNVERAVRAYESAGVAAIQLEDQVLPKRCGHMGGKEVAPVSEMVSRVRAAVAARRDPSFVVIARSDARAVEGLDAAIARCAAYGKAGADVLFLEAPATRDELVRVGRELAGLPLMANMVEGGRTPLLPAQELHALGFALVIFPGLLTRVTARAATDALAVLAETGDSANLLDRLVPFDGIQEIVGLADFDGRRAAYEEGASA
jgi:2-methylisocitrate lyase-like PEP mutase family enzyme